MDSVAAIVESIRAGATTAVEVTSRVLERITTADSSYRAFVALDGDRALRRAAELDAERRAGQPCRPLHGVPIAYKDLCFITGLPTACGTDVRDYFTADGDCDVAQRLSAAGAVTIGKLAMTQLAMGTFGVGGDVSAPVNPWAPDRIPGGSSSGCGVALAAGLVPAAVGTDTGGSIRIPAACCGVTGFKPTYDLVSRRGVMPLSPSLDHVGPMARTVGDLELLLSAMAQGRQRGDVIAARTREAGTPEGWTTATRTGLRGVRVGVAAGEYFEAVSADVERAVAGGTAVLRELGATVTSVELPEPRRMTAATAVIARWEAAATHGRLLDERPQALQPLVRARLEEGRRIGPTAYREALAECAGLREGFIHTVFTAVDVVLAPITPRPPLAVTEVGDTIDQMAERMASWARFARLFNGLGIPVLVLPVDVTPDGLPLAVQLAAPPFHDGYLLSVGRAMENATCWPQRLGRTGAKGSGAT